MSRTATFTALVLVICALSFVTNAANVDRSDGDKPLVPVVQEDQKLLSTLSHKSATERLIDDMGVLPFERLVDIVEEDDKPRTVSFMQMCIKGAKKEGDKIVPELNDYPVCKHFQKNYPTFVLGIASISLQKYPDARTLQLMEEQGEAIQQKYLDVLKTKGKKAYDELMEKVYKKAKDEANIRKQIWNSFGREPPTYEQTREGFKKFVESISDLFAAVDRVYEGAKDKVKDTFRDLLKKDDDDDSEGQDRMALVDEEEALRSNAVTETSPALMEVENPLVKNSWNMWNKGIFSYYLDPDLPTSITANFEAAVGWWASKTCIRFRRVLDIRGVTGSTVKVFQSPTNACSSAVGRISSMVQSMELSEWCKIPEISHEIGHALGMSHTHMRHDRDEYVTVHMDNIEPDIAAANFKKVSEDKMQTLVPYDYGSIMHYCSSCGAKRGMEAITPKKEGVKIGQREKLSKLDIEQINKLYQCLPEDNNYKRCPYDRPLRKSGFCVAKLEEGDVCYSEDECEGSAARFCVDNMCVKRKDVKKEKKESVDEEYTGDLEPRPLTHTVTKNDFGHLLFVAERYNGHPEDFAAFNGWSDHNKKLEVGQVIKLPPYGWKKGDPMPAPGSYGPGAKKNNGGKTTTGGSSPAPTTAPTPTTTTTTTSPTTKKEKEDPIVIEDDGKHYIHTVDSNDHGMVIHVASRFNVDVHKFCSLNGISLNTKLVTGQKVRIPSVNEQGKEIDPKTGKVKEPVIGRHKIYIAQSGDSYMSIAMKYNMRIQDLTAFNGKKLTHRVQVGEKVMIPY